MRTSSAFDRDAKHQARSRAEDELGRAERDRCRRRRASHASAAKPFTSMPLVESRSTTRRGALPADLRVPAGGARILDLHVAVLRAAEHCAARNLVLSPVARQRQRPRARPRARGEAGLGRLRRRPVDHRRARLGLGPAPTAAALALGLDHPRCDPESPTERSPSVFKTRSAGSASVTLAPGMLDEVVLQLAEQAPRSRELPRSAPER